MTRFLRNLLIVNGAIAISLVVAGVLAGWTAPDYTVALSITFAVALLISTASLGGTGPMTNIGGGGGTFSGGVGDVIARGVEAQSAYAGGAGTTKGDYVGRWRARQGWNPGSRGAFFLFLATSVLTGTASVVSWKVFE